MDKMNKIDIYQAFLNKELLVKSVTKDKKIEWKPITDVMKHPVINKTQYKMGIENGTSCAVTEDHSLFLDKKDTIESLKTKDFKIGDSLVFIENDNIVSRKIDSLLIIPSIPFMYDLSVQDNENFVLESGILAHNSFRPPASEKFIQGQTQVFGFIWEDEELLEYLYMAVDDFNSRPPVTGIIIDNLWGTERRWRTTIILRAAAFACFAIAMNWIADEFSLGEENKVSLRIGEEGEIKEMPIGDIFNEIYGDSVDKQSKIVKRDIANLKYGKFLGFILSLFNRIKTKKEKSEIRKAFENDNLYIKSYNKKNKKIVWVPLKNVMRHYVKDKRQLEIKGDGKTVTTTEDHSLFGWKDNSAIKSSQLKKGSIIISEKNNNPVPLEVDSVKDIERRKYMYDLSVPGNENFFLSSGILAHNSYSISGVSLDIEKSSKYQSMKDEYINEYDKLVEANKESIKIIKGLRQFRYGVGITSALGPLNRPGVQSRRNLLTPGYGSLI